jgi:hypothetical protein
MMKKARLLMTAIFAMGLLLVLTDGASATVNEGEKKHTPIQKALKDAVYPIMSKLPILSDAVKPAIVPDSAKLKKIPGNMPINFIENRGQVDKSVRYYARGNGMTVWFTDTEIVFEMVTSKDANAVVSKSKRSPLHHKSTDIEFERQVIRMKLKGGNESPGVTGRDRRESTVNYFIGSDPINWRTNVPVFNEVYYKDVYAGIDLRFYKANGGQIEYDFVAHPGSDTSAIEIAFEGVDAMKIADNGDLIIQTAFGDLVQKAPRIYQYMGDKQVDVKGSFWTKTLGNAFRKTHAYGFSLATYDKSRKVIIDPQVVFSRYFPGYNTNDNVINAITTDSDNNLYVAGKTAEYFFPLEKPIQNSRNGSSFDGFVSKFSSDGTTLLFSTFFGGYFNDEVTGIGVDAGGNVVIAGNTESADFPIKNAFQSATAGYPCGFVARIDASGSSLVYSTYLGGNDENEITSVVVDSAGTAHVAGYTHAIDFPVRNALQPVLGGGLNDWDGFIAKIDPSGTMLFSTFFGGNNTDIINAIALDPGGNIYVAGYTLSGENFPPAGPQPFATPGSEDGFISKIDPAGTHIIYSTILGGRSHDAVRTIAIDADGNAYLAGITYSDDFPVKIPYKSTRNSIFDGFILKLDPTGKNLIYSTYIGAGYQPYDGDLDAITSIVVDHDRNIIVGGRVTVPGLEMKHPLQSEIAGLDDVFIFKLDQTGSTLLFSTYLGGSQSDYLTGLAVDGNGNLYVAGYTYSSDFPVTIDSRSSSYMSDGFIAKISFNCASFTPMVSSLFESSGGSSSFEVLTDGSCTWNATSNNAWINIISGSSGTKDGTVIYAVSPNTSGTGRTGTIVIGGQTFTVTQDGVKQYLLGVSKSGSGSGTITSSDSKINCGSACNATYPSGSAVTLTALPNSGSSFSGWSGGICSGTGTCTLSMSTDATITAAFAPEACTYKLDAMNSAFSSSAGTDSVKVITQSGCKWSVTNSLSWLTITSGSSGTGNGTAKYSVAANTGTTSRSGTLTIAGQTFSVTQDGVKQFALTAAKSGTGSGTITSSDSKINCGSTCSANYSPGASVTLIAASASSSTFSGWSGGGCSGTGICTVTVNAATTVTASFTTAPCTFTLGSASVNATGDAGSDSVKVNTQSGCAWTTTNGLSWVTISSGSSGSGSGPVSLTISANSTGASRSGSLTIAGNTYTIYQAASTGAPLGYTFCSNQNAHCTFTGTKQVAFGANGKFTYKSFSNGVDCNTTNFTDPIPGVTKACYTQGTTCVFSIDPTTKNFAAASDTGTIGVTASTSSCSRTAKSNVSWITISSGASGTGNGTVGYSVTANTTTSSRTGTITAAGQIYTVTQDGLKQYALSVSKGGAGSGTVKSSDSKINCGTTCSANYNSGASVTLTATVTTGSTFSGWSGGGCSGTGSCVVSISAATTVNAIFTTPACTFSVAPMSKTFTETNDNGSAAVTASSSTCTWTASSNSSWITVTSGSGGTGSGTVNFSASANGGTSVRTATVTIAGQALTINQNGSKQYTLTIAKAGSGSGTITSGDNSINCGSGCSAAYNSGVSVSLNAMPASGSALTGWSGGGCSGTGSCSIAVSSNTTVTATFAPCTLGISPTSNSFTESGGSGNIAVTASLGNCPWSSTSNVPWIVITSGATGKGNGTAGYAVETHTGTASRTGTITIAGQTFTIVQAGVTQYTLTIAKTGAGSGTITSADSKINCGSTCTAVYSSGASVSLSAAMDSGMILNSWSGGGCSSPGTCFLLIKADTTVTASLGICTFGISPNTNTLGYSGGTGVFTVNASAGACTWTATSNAAWLTVSSGGSGTGNGTVSYAVSANTDTSSRTGTITIGGQTFTVTQTGIPQYTLTVAKSGTGSGIVTSAPAGISCGTTCSATYNIGTAIVLTATPDSGSTFTGWSGGCIGTGTCVVNMNANTSVTATYTIAQYIQDIQITSPQNGAVVNSSYVMVNGTVTATSADIGITINGIPATIHNGSWVVNGVPLADGSNTITVKAIDTNQNSITKTITLTKAQADWVQLTANVTSGIAPLTVYFFASTSMQNQAQLYEMDFTGAGAFTTIGQNFDNVTYTYAAEGIYYPVLRVTDSGGNIFTATVTITVVSKANLNTLLTQKWEGMKNALIAGDTLSASNYFCNKTKDEYKQVFDALSTQLPQLVQGMQPIQFIYSEAGTAQYRIKRTQNGTAYTYYIYFTIDEDGIWKLRHF